MANLRYYLWVGKDLNYLTLRKENIFKKEILNESNNIITFKNFVPFLKYLYLYFDIY